LENYIYRLIVDSFDAIKSSKFTDMNFDIKKMIMIEKDKPEIYCIMAVVAIMFSIKAYYSFQRTYKSINGGQKGVASWTTLQEIQEQYKEIPLKTHEFKGGGGFPVAEYKDNIYIDDTPVNNLIIGITRSGKGEMFVFKLIDIYSRAEEKASMIVTDPKLELAPASRATLEKRGYDIHVLNLADPKYSMGYNPLELIIESYKEKDYSNAELLCQTFCFSIFSAGGESDGDSAFFNNTSTSLLSALILAHIEDCLEEDRKDNERLKEEFMQKVSNFNELDQDEKTEIEEKFAKLHKLENIPEDMKNDGNRNEINELKAELEDYALSEEDFVESHKHEKEINMFSIISAFSTMANIKLDDNTTALDYYFNSRPDSNRAKLLYAGCGLAGGENKGTVFANTLAKINIFSYENNAKMTAESTIKLEDIGYGEKPVAIFISMPDYDKSNHFIASVFIKQLYFILSKKASSTPSGKCKREVIFLLDEFGNIPAIEGMASLITVCLGRKIRFDLIIQSYAQIKALYKDDADTIIGNCGNHVYIQTEDIETAESFSKRIGKKTIVVKNRSWDQGSKKRSFSESIEERDLLNPNELMTLTEGQCVITRTMKRKTLKGKNVKPKPIYNKDETKLKFRYTYMLDDFPGSFVWKEMEGVENRLHIDLSNRVFKFREYLEEKQKMDTVKPKEEKKDALSRDLLMKIKDETLDIMSDYKPVISYLDEYTESNGLELNVRILKYGTIRDVLKYAIDIGCYDKVLNIIVKNC